MARRFKVILDPGHGGRDPGAVGPTGLKEKDVTLAVSHRVAFYLSPVMDAVLTRSDDRDFSPADKPFSSDIDIGHRARQVVNKSGADVCVSTHCNSLSTKPEAHGVETFRHVNKPLDDRLARAIQKRLAAATGRADRGVKTANFGMIRVPTMPAALVELPFISNPAEEELLRGPGFQDRCARAIAEGVAEYLGEKLPSTEEMGNMPFMDVNGHWGKSDIEQAEEWGLVAVPADKRFRPNDGITRAEVIVLVVRTVRFIAKLFGRQI